MAKRRDESKPGADWIDDLRRLLTADEPADVIEAVAPGSSWARSVLEGRRASPAAPLEPALAAALVAELSARGDADGLGYLAGQRTDRALAKTARTAAHRLRTQGVEVPVQLEAAPVEAVQADADDAEAGVLSGYDGRGQRIIWLMQPQSRGVLVHRGRLSWRGGLLELKTGSTTRREYRRIVRQLQESDLALVEIDGALARWYLHDGAQRVKALGRGLPEGYLLASRLLGKVSDEPHPGLAVPARDEGLLALYDSVELAGWQPEREALRELAQRLQEIAESRLLADEAQRRAQAQHAIEGAASAHFADEARRRASRSFLLDVAHLAALRKDDDLAGSLRAAATLFESPTVGEHPFGLRYIERLFDLERVVHLASHASDAQPEPAATEQLVVP